MYSGAVRDISETSEAIYGSATATVAAVDRIEPVKVYDPWKDWPVSEISHHGAFCCESSREWLLAMDFSELGGESLFTGPRWLKKLFTWGASEFPIYWCEAVKKENLDCGALAAMAYEIFRARGVKTLRAQMVQRFSKRSIEQWREHWGSAGQLQWTADDVIYHEGCAVVTRSGELKIWDSSAGWWIEPSATDGYGALLALRVSDRKLINTSSLTWRGQKLEPFVWTDIVSTSD